MRKIQSSSSFTRSTQQNSRGSSIRAKRAVILRDDAAHQTRGSFWVNKVSANPRRVSSRKVVVGSDHHFSISNNYIKDKQKVEVLELEKWKFDHSKQFENITLNEYKKEKMKKKTLLRGPDIDTKLIDGILRGNRRPKTLVLDIEVENQPKANSLYAPIQEHSAAAVAKMNTDFSMRLIKTIIKREMKKRGGQNKFQNIDYVKKAHEKISNFKHLPSIINKNRFLIWDNFSKEGPDKRESELNSQGSEVKENLALSSDYSFMHLKNSITSLLQSHLRIAAEKLDLMKQHDSFHREMKALSLSLKQMQTNLTKIQDQKKSTIQRMNTITQFGPRRQATFPTNHPVLIETLKELQKVRRENLSHEEQTFEKLKNTSESKKSKKEEFALIKNQLERLKSKKRQVEFRLVEICSLFLNEFRLCYKADFVVWEIILLLRACKMEVIFDMFPHYVSPKIWKGLMKLARCHFQILLLQPLKEGEEENIVKEFLKKVLAGRERELAAEFSMINNIQTLEEKIESIQKDLAEGIRRSVISANRDLEYFPNLDVLLYSIIGKQKSLEELQKIKLLMQKKVFKV